MTVARVFLMACLCMPALGCLGPASDVSVGAKPQMLARGATISGANGLHFGPDGLLYVASVMGSEIVVLDPDSGDVRLRISEGVDGPDDLAFASDGSFFWTSILTGEVAGIRPDGRRVTAARLTPGSNPLTFSPDDRLFVSQCFFDDKLYEVDPDGVDPPRLISDRLGPHCGLNGMDWGPDGRLYGPRWFRGEVVSFDVDTLEMRTEARGFNVPAAVKFDSRGRLHVLDTGAGEVIRLDGRQRTVVASLGPGLDNLAFDDGDRLFVSSFVDGFVARVEKDGSNTLLTPSGLTSPGGLTSRIGASGLEIIVADLQSIRGFNASTGEPIFVERNVFGVSEMGSVSNIATDIATDRTNLILTSWLDGTVKIWDPSERKVIRSYSNLAAPVSALRYEGRIVIAEHGKRRVISVGDEEAGATRIIASELPAPTGLAMRGGDLFVTDRERGELLRIAHKGTPLEKPQLVASGLGAPEGVSATTTGFVVVDGETGRLLEVDTSGRSKLLAQLVPGLPAATAAEPPSMIFNGVLVSREGVIFATGETNRVVYRIDPNSR